MIHKYFNDGESVNAKDLKKCGFNMNFARDFTTVVDPSFENDLRIDNNLNFVGFTTNFNNDIITVFPKKYKPRNIETDSKKIFKTIFKHIQRNPEMYIGSEFDKHIDTNYPFAAFYKIYNYFQKYGLHFEQEVTLKPYGSGRINWKETIRLSQKFVLDGELIMFPIFHEHKNRIDTFLASCMIYVIDYTLDKFSIFLDEHKTNQPFPEFDFRNNKDFVLQNLYSIKNTTYNDLNISLIDDLIDYFNGLSSKGQYYLKHYSFYSIWEDMVFKYLNCFFLGFSDGKMILSNHMLKNNFSKPIFYPNLVNKTNSFQPDFYLTQDKTQIILDAKYYDVASLDYKQISYILFLKNKRESLSQEPKYNKTYAALVIPSEERSSKEHFKMDPLYNKECSDFYISEERLSIYKIIDFWINIYL